MTPSLHLMLLVVVTVGVMSCIVRADYDHGHHYKCHPKVTVKQHTVPVYTPYHVYKKYPVYKYEKYPVEVPVKYPVYVKVKHYDHKYEHDKYGHDDKYGHHGYEHKDHYGHGYDDDYKKKA